MLEASQVSEARPGAPKGCGRFTGRGPGPPALILDKLLDSKEKRPGWDELGLLGLSSCFSGFRGNSRPGPQRPHLTCKVWR